MSEYMSRCSICHDRYVHPGSRYCPGCEEDITEKHMEDPQKLSFGDVLSGVWMIFTTLNKMAMHGKIGGGSRRHDDDESQENNGYQGDPYVVAPKREEPDTEDAAETPEEEEDPWQKDLEDFCDEHPEEEYE